MPRWIDDVHWGPDGLVAAVAQNPQGRVLMLAWMNRAALEATVAEGRAVYWSRSRERLWRKGEESGHEQRVLEIRLDCDGDAILLTVEQKGGIACHTGRASCFFRKLAVDQWVPDEPVLKDPSTIYGKPGGS
ncbi:MAG: phosphoribosyl-AMP cyclohydrolase [Acidiferrobacteraceae bacterium]